MSSRNSFTTFTLAHVGDNDGNDVTTTTCAPSSIPNSSLQSTLNRTTDTPCASATMKRSYVESNNTCNYTGTGTGTSSATHRKATATNTTKTDTVASSASSKDNKLVSRKRLRTTNNINNAYSYTTSNNSEQSLSESSVDYDSKNDCESDSNHTDYTTNTIILREEVAVHEETSADYYSNIIDHEEIQQRLPLPNESNYDPDDYLIMLLNVICPHIQLQVKSTNELNHYFPTPTEQQMLLYTTEIVNIVRLNNTSAMKDYYNQHGRDVFNCCNRFGEGLLNMACRRGFIDIVQFLLSPDVQLSVRTRDDGGRTPLHDACWNPDPQIDICTWIIQKDPSLFLVADKRGYTPFQYARKGDWYIWRQFLYNNYKSLYNMMKPEIANTFQKK